MEEQKLEKEKKKIRGNKQTGILIALDPKSASKPYCFWGCPQVQSTRQHTASTKGSQTPHNEGQPILKLRAGQCVLFVCPLSHPVIAPARYPFLAG